MKPLFFELERNWTGLLIEPVPDLYIDLVYKRRHAYTINACIADNRPFVVALTVPDDLSGLENEMSKSQKDRLRRMSKQKREIVYVPCFSLNTIMSAVNRTTTVDYFSLDVEGAELKILKSIDFKRLNIKAFTVEWASRNATRPQIIRLLNENGYLLRQEDIFDLYFTKKTN